MSKKRKLRTRNSRLKHIYSIGQCVHPVLEQHKAFKIQYMNFKLRSNFNYLMLRATLRFKTFFQLKSTEKLKKTFDHSKLFYSNSKIENIRPGYIEKKKHTKLKKVC